MTLGSNFVVTVKSDATRAALTAMSERIVAHLASTIRRLGLELVRHVKEDKLSGQVLNVRTGTLRRSINLKMSAGSGSVKGSVGTNVEYAAIHEFGGHVPAVEGKLMVFPNMGVISPSMLNADLSAKKRFKTRKHAELFVFTMKHKAFDLPERSFLRSALEDMKPLIEVEVKAAVAEAING